MSDGDQCPVKWCAEPMPHTHTTGTPSADDPKKAERGLESRYNVGKIEDPTGKHDDCRYFVLDPKHDPIARVALNAYAFEAKAMGYDALALELLEWVNDIEPKD